uniref:Large ribosomal subunit protein uL4 C-terminal domain-containing protein n=1 Tax=Bicosoecida sp. CB-2014 TaxID=1486930 RepID=A0A7S1GBQ5_9STRA
MAAATASARPVVTVYDGTSDSSAVAGSAPLPAVFTTPIRRDVVHDVHRDLAKNARQAFAVSKDAGHQTAALSWGTGRAVARIPRVPGGGTHRSGQAAFGNMCRGGHMFAPTRTWRKWHRHVNQQQRRYATASALAASAVPALVMARGHAIDEVDEIPLVLANIEDATKTAKAEAVLNAYGAGADVDRCRDSRKVRPGKGKMRNRRYVMRTGPLVIHAGGTAPRAFRNLPGVDTAHVDRLNLLQLAPGGHLGRFIVWTQEAFNKLDDIFGTHDSKSAVKGGFQLPRAAMTNADIGRIVNSTEVQSVVRPAKDVKKYGAHKKNPLRNKNAMAKLNPYYAVMRKTEQRVQAAKQASRTARNAKAAARRSQSKAFYAKLLADE